MRNLHEHDVTERALLVLVDGEWHPITELCRKCECNPLKMASVLHGMVEKKQEKTVTIFYRLKHKTRPKTLLQSSNLSPQKICVRKQ